MPPSDGWAAEQRLKASLGRRGARVRREPRSTYHGVDAACDAGRSRSLEPAIAYEEPLYDPDSPPRADVTIVYGGPAAPHWDIRTVSGDRSVADAFAARVNARLMLLPAHDPQFRRNRERVNKDAEREHIRLTWDLGYDEGDDR